mgnify:CR=1 FL=1
MFVTLRFIGGFKNTVKSSIISGKRKINSPSIRGKWMKPISKIKGRWHYLYRAIDADGLTLDIWLQKKRDTQAAYAFLKRLHKQFGQPRVIVTDKAPPIGSAFRKLQSNGLYTKTEHRTVKYLNHLIEQDHRPIKLIEQDHRPIKRRNKFIEVYELPQPRLRAWKQFEEYTKRTEEMERSYGFSVSTEIKVLMVIIA